MSEATAKPSAVSDKRACAGSASVFLGMHEVVNGWTYVGWIKNDPVMHSLAGTTFEKLKRKAVRSDHGEERIIVERKDGGVNVFFREPNS